MNPVYSATASSPLSSPLFAPTPWACYLGGQVGISCCMSVPSYQSSPFMSSPCAIASPDLYWGCSSLSEGQVGISHLASVPPVPYMSPILSWPPYLPTSIIQPPHGMLSTEFYWGRSSFSPPDSQWGISPCFLPQVHSLQHPLPNIIPSTLS